MAISAQAVRELNKMTGVGIMDCKKALTETNGDVDAAIQILREKGLATQAKKAGRVAAEGIAMALVNADNSVGAVVEVNIETDFAAKNEEFKNFVKAVAQTVIDKNPADVEALKEQTIAGGSETVGAVLTELAGMKIRENISIRRFERVEGILVPYIHAEGKIGVMVQLESAAGNNEKVLEAGKNCALQIAAMNPAYLCKEDVPADIIANEKDIAMKQIAEDPKMANKPEQVIAKIAEGKVGKYYKENCLIEQEYVKDPSMNVQQYVNSVAKEVGSDIKVVKYIRFERGEGIEKKEDDFAAEVASMMK